MTNSTSEREQRLKQDKELAHRIVWERGSDNWNSMEDRILEAFTTIRQEERRAALERHAKVVCGFCERGNPVQFIAGPNCFKHELEGETPWTTCRANDMRMVEVAANENKGEAND